MKRNSLIAIVWLYLPMVIFLVGWTEWWIAVPVLALMGIALWFCIKSMDYIVDKENECTLAEISIAFVVFFAVMLVCGQGDLFYQDLDWHKHHAILYDLVHYDWPVVYQNDAMLTYYIGQYIVPAAVAKVFGGSEVVAVWSLAIWNTMGLTIGYVVLCRYLKIAGMKKRLLLILFICFWGGFINLGSVVYQMLGHGDIHLHAYKWLDNNRLLVHFTSNLDSLLVSFQHVIVPWICCGLFLQNRKKYSTYVVWVLPLLFTATFGFLYMVLMMGAVFVLDMIVDKELWNKIKQALSVSNILLMPLAVVILIYMAGNVLAEKPDGMGWDLLNMFTRIDFYIVFILSEFLVYMLLLFNKNKKDVLFWVILLELLFIPFISLGRYNDLCSRGCVPARFILMVYCIKALYEDGLKIWRNRILAVLIAIAMLNSLNETVFTIKATIRKGIGSAECICNEYKSYEGWAANPYVAMDNAYNYYTLNYSESLFKKIAKEGKE